MAKKHDDKDRVVIRFDNEDGEALGEEPVIDLFADDDEEDAPRPKAPKKANTGKKPVKADGQQKTAPQKAAGAQSDAAAKDALPKAEEASPSDGADGQAVKEAEELKRMFDRDGKRIRDRKKKSRYGKRKNAPKVETKVVQNETIARREYEAAQARSRARAERREDKARREKERKQRERRTRRRSLLKTALLGIGAALILIVMAWYTTRIRTIEVVPVPDGYAKSDIIDISGIRYGSSIVFQSLSEAKANLEQDAYLRANVRYEFPSTVRISLETRTAAACVRWGPQSEFLAIIDSAGVVLNAEAESTGGLIVAEGLSITSAQNGKMLGEATDIQIASLVRILSALEEMDLLNRSPRLARIDMRELMNISIATEGANYSIEVGDSSNLETKLRLLQKHWTEIMNRAAQYVANGASTATIYLYSKGGVSVSPYEPGYNLAMQNALDYSLLSDNPVTTPAPGEPAVTPDPDAPPSATPTPAPTQMPHQGGTFTG